MISEPSRFHLLAKRLGITNSSHQRILLRGERGFQRGEEGKEGRRLRGTTHKPVLNARKGRLLRFPFPVPISPRYPDGILFMGVRGDSFFAIQNVVVSLLLLHFLSR